MASVVGRLPPRHSQSLQGVTRPGPEHARWSRLRHDDVQDSRTAHLHQRAQHRARRRLPRRRPAADGRRRRRTESDNSCRGGRPAHRVAVPQLQAANLAARRHQADALRGGGDGDPALVHLRGSPPPRDEAEAPVNEKMRAVSSSLRAGQAQGHSWRRVVHVLDGSQSARRHRSQQIPL